MANESKAPSGIAISRSKEKLVIKWKQKETYKSQQLQYRLNRAGKKDSWKSISVGAGTTAKAITIDRDKYHPNKNVTLSSVSFRVRGKANNKDWSDWAKKTYNILVPHKPSVSVSQNSELPNRTTFSWSLSKSDTDKRIYTKVQYQSLLVSGNAKPNWNKASYAYSAQDGTSGNVTYTEDTSVIATGSHTRYFRARAVGPQGASDWVTKSFVHSLPFQASNVKAVVKETDEGGLNAGVTWTTKIDKAHPVAKTTVEYAMVVPDANLECPSGASWTEGDVSKDIVDKNTNTATSKAVFSIDDVLGKDECLFIRVNTQHAEETNINYGDPVLAQVGELKDPSDPVVSDIDTSTHRVTITAVNNSEVEDSILAIIYRSNNEPDADFIIDTLPYNNSYTKTIQCPDWGDDVIGFGVYAVVGEVEEKIRADGVGSYAIDEQMRSANTIWAGGSVPQSPTGITANQTEIPGTIRVTWDWNWEEADSAVLSWADHIDAWESTDEPDEFTINKVHASQWNISGLETGKTWYIRVRLVKGTEDDLTYGPWSKIVSVDLSSAPNIPTLVLSEDVITVDGTVTASWAYSSTDATAQAYAKICEVEITSEGIEYGELIAHATTEQHVDIPVVDGWQAGETYYLCLNVMSASGRESNWSDPVSITVAEPIECEITETSLVTETSETNPREFEKADLVTFETEMAEAVTKAEVSLEPIQDLNGYDHPWPAGGGKNLLNIGGRVNQATAQVTYTSDDDYVILNGTKQGGGYANLSTLTITLPAGTYYAKAIPVSGTATSNISVYPFDGSADVVGNIFDSEKSFTLSEEKTFYFRFAIWDDGTVFTNYKIGIVISETSGIDKFYPYSNICPIEGYEDVRVDVLGGVSMVDMYEDNIIKSWEAMIEGDSNWNHNPAYFRKAGGYGNGKFSFDVEEDNLPMGARSFGRLDLTNGGTTDGNIAQDSIRLTVGKTYLLGAFSRGYGRMRIACTQDNYYRTVDTDMDHTDWRFYYGFFTAKTSYQNMYWCNYRPYSGAVDWCAPILYELKDNESPEDFINTNYTIDLVTNIWDEEWEVGGYETSNGQKNTSTLRIRSKNYINALPNTVYYGMNDINNMYCYDASKNYLGVATYARSGSGWLFTTLANTRFITFDCTIAYGTTYNNDISINYPPMPDGKVYGGTLDLVSGSLVIDRAMVDLGTLNWEYDSTYSRFQINPSLGQKTPADNNTIANIICTAYKTVTDNQTASANYNKSIGMSVVGRIDIRDTAYTDVAEFKTAMSGVQLCYELATPQTYQLTAQQIQTLIGTNNVWSDEGQIEVSIAESLREILALTKLPMTVTVEGAGDGGTTTVAIERFENYHMTRPDETEFNGYEGETVFLRSQTGEEQMEITLDDLIGTLDDEASYQIVATVKDAYGQSATTRLDFEVAWEHQAIIPTATVEIDDTEYIAKITVPQPTGAITGDTFDIYRLSADRPELIIEGGTWGVTYVDPYPALGEYGYRIVFRTLYGDYITEDHQPAWIDVIQEFEPEDVKSIIDFAGIQILLSRNVDVGNTWEKAFEETRYLGGSVQGDWNIAVGRSGTATTTAITIMDETIIADIRRLAMYPGICHIRTFDGSSFSCDIQVSEDRDHESYGSLAEFSFTITRVDPEDLDGLTLAEWEA